MDEPTTNGAHAMPESDFRFDRYLSLVFLVTPPGREPQAYTLRGDAERAARLFSKTNRPLKVRAVSCWSPGDKSGPAVPPRVA